MLTSRHFSTLHRRRAPRRPPHLDSNISASTVSSTTSSKSSSLSLVRSPSVDTTPHHPSSSPPHVVLDHVVDGETTPVRRVQHAAARAATTSVARSPPSSRADERGGLQHHPRTASNTSRSGHRLRGRRPRPRRGRRRRGRGDRCRRRLRRNPSRRAATSAPHRSMIRHAIDAARVAVASRTRSPTAAGGGGCWRGGHS